MDWSEFERTSSSFNDGCFGLNRKPIQTPDMLYDLSGVPKLQPFRIERVYYKLPNGIPIGYGKGDIVFGQEYYISAHGDIYNKTTGKHLAGTKQKGKEQVRRYTFTLQGTTKTVDIFQHRLVACMFLKHQIGMSCVYHIDLNLRNNHCSNLMFCSPEGKSILKVRMLVLVQSIIIMHLF